MSVANPAAPGARTFHTEDDYDFVLSGVKVMLVIGVFPGEAQAPRLTLFGDKPVPVLAKNDATEIGLIDMDPAALELLQRRRELTVVEVDGPVITQSYMAEVRH